MRHRVPVQLYFADSRVHWEKISDSPFDSILFKINDSSTKKEKIFIGFFASLYSVWYKIERHATKEDERKTEKATKRKCSFGLSIGRLHIAALCVFI